MAEYIERGKALEKAVSTGLCDAQGNMYGAGDVVLADDIKSISPSDVAPVVHGRWIRVRWVSCDDPDGGYWIVRCDQCCIPQAKEYRFCPSCGAKMDEEGL